MPTARYRSSCARVNDLFYVIGGIDKTNHETGAVEAYCPYNDTWIEFPSLQQPRAHHEAAFAEGSIFVFGGAKGDHSESFASAERFDPPLPDLVVSGSELYLEPQGPALDGDALNISATVTNAGSWPARSVPVEVRIDGEHLDSTTIPFMEVDESRTVTVPWTSTTGRHDVEVWVDPNASISETALENNRASTHVEVHPRLPDLWVNGSTIAIKETGYVAGDPVEVNADVENRGWTRANDIAWRMTVDGEEAASGTLERGVERGEIVYLAAEWTCVVGIHEIAFTVDCEGEEIGLFPSTNSTTVRVPQRPDLVFAVNPRIEPANVTEGDDFEVVFSIKNVGEVAVPGSTVRVLYNGDLVGELSVEPLGANGTRVMRRTVEANAPGRASVTVIIDPGDEIKEADEANNEYLVEFQVLERDADGGIDEQILLYLVAGVIIVIIVIVAFILLYSKRQGGKSGGDGQ